MKKRFSLALAVASAMAATALLFGAGPAAAATNVYCPSDDLQTAIDNASQGATLTIFGTCYGNFVVDGTNTTNFGQLTLQGGSSGATLNGRGAGSTLLIEYQAVVTIRNLTITNGSGAAGGGLSVDQSDLIMVNATVKGNRAGTGGGIYASGSELDLTGVTVTRNTADYQGGGISVFGSLLSMTASTVSLNKSNQFGIEYGGGGILMDESNVLLTSTKVTSNTSADYGGGIADYGACRIPSSGPAQQIRCLDGGAKVAGQASGKAIIVNSGLTLVNSSVDHNIAADDGGGIYNESQNGDSPVEIRGSVVSFNTAKDGEGGGIANYGVCGWTASLLVTGSKFQGNNARNGEGGAIFNGVGTDGCNGAGTALLTIADSGVTNARNNLNQNQAKYGGGIANEQYDGYASTSIQAGAQITGNKASVTGGGVWNNCGSLLKAGGNVLLNTPNNIVSGCVALQ